eukprot:14171709-Alexandrium_andersonii.AAC.1
MQLPTVLAVDGHVLIVPVVGLHSPSRRVAATMTAIASLLMLVVVLPVAVVAHPRLPAAALAPSRGPGPRRSLPAGSARSSGCPVVAAAAAPPVTHG